MGSPGSGKGTLAGKCIKELKYTSLSVGNLLREEIAQRTPLGKKVECIKEGKFVSDELVMELVEAWLTKNLTKIDTLILDGFPRTARQAELFLDLLRTQFNNISFRVINLIVTDETAVHRLADRLVCEKCQEPESYQLLKNPTKLTCEMCGSNLIKRDDDKEEVVRNRLKVSAQHTKLLLDVYTKADVRTDSIDVEKKASQHIFDEFKELIAIPKPLPAPKSLIATDACFFVEGATGAGKTTFIQLLGKELPNVSTIYEPIESFTNVNGAGNILELFFTDQKRWAFTAESYIALMHTKTIENRAKGSPTSAMFVDGSMYADCYVFGKMDLRLGTMNPLEWEIYKQLISSIAKNTTVKPRGFIYLQTSPQVALERVRVRNRIGEKDVSLEYEENLDSCYREWFIEKKDIPNELAQIPVLIIDATQNFKDDPIVQQQCIQRVKEFIGLTQ